MNYKTDFLDDPLWVELAGKAGLRLPRLDSRLTGNRVKAFARRLGLAPEADFWTGYPTWKRAFEANPTWPGRAWCGLLLEEWAAQRGGSA